MKNKFSIKERIYSFKYAFDGFKTLIKDEHNARIHLIATAIAVMAGIYFEINRTEWINILFTIGLVISMEAINSAIENLSDIVCPEKNPIIKKVKDLSALAVLICAIVAILIGILIFLPKIITQFNF